MKTLWGQLQSWPPLPLTVVGLAILAGLVAFEAAGGTADLAASVPAALGAIGALKVILPQQSGPTLDEIDMLATRLLAAARAPAPKATTDGGSL